MKKRVMLMIGGVLLASALVAVGVRAATAVTTPTTLGYAGTLLSGTSPAADGNYSLVFTLFPTATGAGSLWSETQATVPVIAGRFNVVLGATTPIPSAALSSTELWLEITVGSEVLSPRQRVTSVPFALRAPLQCRTVTVTVTSGDCANGCNCNGGTSGTWNASAVATCDPGEFLVGGACPGPGYASLLASSMTDTSYSCNAQTQACGNTTTTSYTAMARCCKM